MKENPRLEINIGKISKNAKTLVKDCAKRGISVSGITKGVCGMPEVAKVMVDAGVSHIGDSRLDNVEKMIDSGVEAPFMLLRAPQYHELEKTVDLIDVSLQSELRVIRALNKIAASKGKVHKIVLMIEMGDLREGILFRNWRRYCRVIKDLQNVSLSGLGVNFGCASGVLPTVEKMNQFSSLVDKVEHYMGGPLDVVSGGSSVNLNLMYSGWLAENINNIRLGEAILLGVDDVGGPYLKRLRQDTMRLVCEIIELKKKAAAPAGKPRKTYHKKIKTNKIIERAILAMGRQDAFINSLKPVNDSVDVLTSSSDHTVLDVTGAGFNVWDEVVFEVDYHNMVNLMTSDYVYKKIVK